MRDDLVPEEAEPAYTPLMTALRASAHQREPIPTAEQVEILARVQERLAGATTAAASPDVRARPRQHPFVPGIPRQHPGRSRRWGVRLLVALGILLLILGSSWALFKAAPFSRSTAVRPTAPVGAPTAETQVGGLEAAMQVMIAGPYFLGELLPVDVSLTNQTPQMVQLMGLKTTATLCHDSALMVGVTAGSDPNFVFPRIARTCDQVLPATQVQPGETLTIHQEVPLTRSGAVTLSMHSDAADTPMPFAPLEGHWPTVQIQVQLQAPQDRALALENQQGKVIIELPAGAQAHLLEMQSISCDLYLAGGDLQWTPLATTVLEEPTCPTAHPHWEYVVSAPGYSIVSGSQ